MKHLIIIRHATAEEQSPDGTDAGRLLARRGQEQARAQGQTLRRANVPLQGFIASPAARAEETATLMAEAGEAGWRVETADSLYGANADMLLRFVQRLPNELDYLALVAHNPGVSQLVSLLITENRDLFLLFEAGTMVGVQIDADLWADVAPGHGMLQWYLPPLFPAT